MVENMSVLKQSPEVAQMDAVGRLGVAIKRIEALQKLVHFFGSRSVHICDGLQDEGDRCYLESTNHADMLLEMNNAYDAYRFETDDMGSERALSEPAT